MGHVPRSSESVARRLQRSRGQRRGLAGFDFSAIAAASGGGSGSYSGSSPSSSSSSGVPPAPSTSTGNARADAFRSSVHKYAAAAALAAPEAAPFIAAGVAIVDGWIAINAAFEGESWDGPDYQDAAAAAAVEYMRRGFVPPSLCHLLDVIFVRDYQRAMEAQLTALTPQGQSIIKNPASYTNNASGWLDPTYLGPAMEEMGRALRATSNDPEVAAFIAAAAKCTGFPSVGRSLWLYGSPFGRADERVVHDKTGSYTESVPPATVGGMAYPDVVAMLAAKNFGADRASCRSLAWDASDNYCNPEDAAHGHDCSVFGSGYPADLSGDELRNFDANRLATLWYTVAKWARAHGSTIAKSDLVTGTGAPAPFVRAAGGSAFSAPASSGKGSSLAVSPLPNDRVIGLRLAAARQKKSTTKGVAALGASAVVIAGVSLLGALL